MRSTVGLKSKPNDVPVNAGASGVPIRVAAPVTGLMRYNWLALLTPYSSRLAGRTSMPTITSPDARLESATVRSGAPGLAELKVRSRFVAVTAYTVAVDCAAAQPWSSSTAAAANATARRIHRESMFTSSMDPAAERDRASAALNPRLD
jgi:hypothetical protein